MYKRQLQQRIDKNALFEADSLLERYQKEGAAAWFEERLRDCVKDGEKEEKRVEALKEAFSLLDGLEVLRKDWREYLSEIRRTLFTDPLAKQWEMPEGFDVKWEQLMVYFVYTYFCGAVYDGKAYGKMKFALMGTLLIREMTRALWVQNGRKKEEKEALFQDLLTAARRYAREIEHSDLNKNTVEQRLEEEQRFGIDTFLRILS